MPREERQSRARRSGAEKPVLTLDVREDGRVKCPVCEQIVSTDEEKQRISKHTSLQLGVVCPYSDRAFRAGGLPEVRQGFRSRAGGGSSSRQTAGRLAEKNRVRSAEELKQAREEVKTARKRSQAKRKRDWNSPEERKRSPHWRDDYAIVGYDSFGREDDGFEPHEREHHARGGLPGHGRRA